MLRGTASILADHEAYLIAPVRPYYRDPLVLVEGRGVEVTDAEGVSYLDLFGGILTTSIGHCHPAVVERVQAQVARLGHISPLYLSEVQTEVARKLADLAPGSLGRTFFVNSGTEAVETAVAMARLYTGRSEVIALRHGYSGRSALGSALTGQAPWRRLPSTASGISHALSPSRYHFPLDLAEEEAAEFFARDLEEVILTCTDGRPAAFLAEAIQGVAGCIVPPRGYFERAAEIIRHYGGLLIVDEVQTGFGRTGEHWFGIEHWGVEPDIMVLAKGMANGFPAGAAITTDAIAERYGGKSISTFGGNPVSMAAADATLEVMMREAVPARAAERGAQLRRTLQAFQQRCAWIGDVRGMGLMQAMEIVTDPVSKTPDPSRAQALLEAAREEKLLLGLGGLHGQVVRIGPSMLISKADLDRALLRLEAACERVDTAREGSVSHGG